MKKSKKMCLLFSCLLLLAFASLPREADAANVVTKQISEIKKVYPQGSRINKWVVVPSIVNKNGDVYYSSIYNGGCNALVAYVTMKVFHNPYVPYSTSYKTIGTAKTSSPSAMNKLFKKAKPGDVVRMSTVVENVILRFFFLRQAVELSCMRRISVSKIKYGTIIYGNGEI